MHSPEKKFYELQFIPARLTEGKNWYVSFYAFNPATGKLARKKIKLNRIKSVSMRRTIGRKMVAEINAKLLQDWSPFIESEAPKAFHKLFDVFDTYIAIQEKEAEENTIRCYRSFLGKLRDYVDNTLKKKDMYVYQFTDSTASEMMLHFNSKTKISVRTYNNYLSFFRLLFNWMVQFKYIKNNPFANMKKKAVPKSKNRSPLPTDIKEKIKTYLLTNNPNYLTLMLIEYYCLLRPKEITYLKLKHIDLKRKFIIVDGAEAKNDNTSFRTIPPQLMPYLQKLNLNGNQENFLFSDDELYKFIPGRKHLDPRKISKYWGKIRTELKFGIEFKFYSIKDSGIIDLLEAGVSIEDVRDQADHHDISVTAVYARHAKPKGSEQIRDLAKDF